MTTVISNDVVGTGFHYPFQISDKTGGVRIQKSTTDKDKVKKIKQSMHLILGTPIGSRPMMREFGSRLHELEFETDDNSLITLATTFTEEALVKWELRIEIVQINVTINRQDLKADINIGFNVVNTDIKENLVYPLYLKSEET